MAPDSLDLSFYCDVHPEDTYYLTLFAAIVPEDERLPCDRVINGSISYWLEWPKLIPAPHVWSVPDHPLQIWDVERWGQLQDHGNRQNASAYGMAFPGDWVYSLTYTDEWKYWVYLQGIPIPNLIHCWNYYL